MIPNGSQTLTAKHKTGQNTKLEQNTSAKTCNKMCSPMLMDNNKIHIRFNVCCLLQSKEHISLALSDIMIHDVTQKFCPLNSRSEKRTLLEDFDQCRPGEKKREGRAGAILPRKVTVITGTLFLKHEDTTEPALYCCVAGRFGWWLFFKVNSY